MARSVVGRVHQKLIVVFLCDLLDPTQDRGKDVFTDISADNGDLSGLSAAL